MVELFANSTDPDQKLHSAASDLGLHCLLVTHLGVSSLQRVKKEFIMLFIQVYMYIIAIFQHVCFFSFFL